MQTSGSGMGIWNHVVHQSSVWRSVTEVTRQSYRSQQCHSFNGQKKAVILVFTTIDVARCHTFKHNVVTLLIIVLVRKSSTVG
jgi:hypothetical protein